MSAQRLYDILPKTMSFLESISWARGWITFVKSFATKRILCTKLISQLNIPIILCNEKRFSYISGFVIKG